MNKNYIIILLILFVIIYCGNKEKNLERIANSHKSIKASKICSEKLSDKQYLEHMIAHHQVAIDISYMLRDITKSPWMKETVRKLIFNQKMEILLMKILLRKLPKNISTLDTTKKLLNSYIPTNGDYTKPNSVGLTKTYCDPHFFDPKSHIKHMKKMKLNDVSYIQHMIPHHMVAVDMSKILIKNTRNDIMVYLAYRIIKSQQAEIILLNQYLNKSTYINQSNLI